MKLQISINAQFCKGCGFCVRFCPEGALAIGKERNKKGDYLPAIAHERCVACGECARMCPEGAIMMKAEGVAA